MFFSLVLEPLVGWNQGVYGRKIFSKLGGDGGQSGHIVEKGGCHVGEGGYGIMVVSRGLTLSGEVFQARSKNM